MREIHLLWKVPKYQGYNLNRMNENWKIQILKRNN